MTTRQYRNWRKSNRSDGSDNCVEVAQADDSAVGVRDSKDATGPLLEFDPTSWRAFISAICAGDFAH